MKQAVNNGGSKVRKLRFLFATMIAITLLSACGNPQATSSKTGNENIAEGESTSQSSTNETNGGITQGEIKILTRDGDKENFTPKTDDYVIAIKNKGDSDGIKYENTILISFDENGKRVQWLERDINGETITYTDLLKEQGYDWVPDSVKSDKYNVLNDLANGSLDSNAINGDYYYSKELTSQQTIFENQYSEADFIELSTFPHATDDYYVIQYTDKFTNEGHTSSNNKRPGSETIGASGSTLYEYDYTVEWYGAFSYSSAIIISFDEAGNQVGFTAVDIMDSEEMVESYLKQRGCDKWDEVSPTTEVDWEKANTMGYHIEGKYIWVDSKESDSTTKTDYALLDTDKTFFSKPYLTDSQINALKTW